MRKIILPIIILSLLFGAVGFAQESELPSPGLTPDSPFYFFDTLAEKISLLFTFDIVKKAEKALRHAEEKLAEAKAMAEQNKTQALEKANQRYQEFLGLANTKVKEAKEEGKDVEELAILITEKTLKHQEVLMEVFEKVPEQAKKGIENAIEMSKRGFEEAVKAVSGEKKEELQQKTEEIKVKVEERIKSLKEKLEERPISCKDSLDCPSKMKCENSVCVDVGCIEEGGMGPSAGINPEWLDHLPIECCEGLKSIAYSRNFDKNCKFMPPPGAPSGVCSKCGNGICEEWETKCNCPKDCFLELKEEVIKDETANWEIYRNEKYGFEIRYPPQYSLKEIEEKSVISFWPTVKSPYLVIWVLNNPRNYTLEKFYNFYNLPENKKLREEEVGKIVYPYYESPDSIESMEIGGISAVKFVVGGYWRLTISIPYKDKIFEIQAQPSAAEEKIFNQILSTFKFIEK